MIGVPRSSVVDCTAIIDFVSEHLDEYLYGIYARQLR